MWPDHKKKIVKISYTFLYTRLLEQGKRVHGDWKNSDCTVEKGTVAEEM